MYCYFVWEGDWYEYAHSRNHIGVVRAAVERRVALAGGNLFRYSVNIQGNASSNFGTQQFWITELAIVRDTGLNGNPFEFVLTTQKDLNVSAQVGDIELMTNSGFAANPGIASALFNLANVSLTNVAQFELDSGASQQLPPPNVFVAPGVGVSPGGLGGLCFLPGAGQDLCRDLGRPDVLQLAYLVPRTGGGYFFFPDGMGATIAGEINVSGSQVDNPSVQGQYQAIFSGTHVGSVACD